MAEQAYGYWLAAPEITLALASMALLMVGVFRGDRATRLVAWLAVLAMLVALVFVLQGPAERTVGFAGMYVVDGFTRFVKVLILIAAGVGVIMSLGYLRNEGVERFEFPVLLLLATLGMLMMVSANNLISLYVGLELQSLALYVTAAFRRDSLRSTEAGLKYFVLGALSSGMLLYGASLVYGFTGTVSFAGIAQAAAQGGIGLIFGI
ncbi:MAG TPA: proton-conducting transporter membrane subunit, partial [Alphaproteobacteria bacterium]|nr:proton-conducting transporter membrane subunit [Alphaproteobacteria bacterium]